MKRIVAIVCAAVTFVFFMNSCGNLFAKDAISVDAFGKVAGSYDDYVRFITTDEEFLKYKPQEFIKYEAFEELGEFGSMVWNKNRPNCYYYTVEIPGLYGLAIQMVHGGEQLYWDNSEVLPLSQDIEDMRKCADGKKTYIKDDVQYQYGDNGILKKIVWKQADTEISIVLDDYVVPDEVYESDSLFAQLLKFSQITGAIEELKARTISIG